VGKQRPAAAKRWARERRVRVINGLLRDALIEIRVLAFRPETSRHPDGNLEEIRLIADVCHNLPGAFTPRPVGEFDALIWTWQTANEFQRSWLRTHFDRMGVDPAFLEQAPRFPPPATAPDTRPSWRRWQLPRAPSAFTAVDTETYVALVRHAREGIQPDPKYGAVREAYIGWMLEHLDPDGSHILRPSRPGETMFGPEGRGDVTQYRALLMMCDGALIVDHPHLRTSDIRVLPTNLSLASRLALAAVPPRRRERDAYLWSRDHRADNPDCRDWTVTESEAEQRRTGTLPLQGGPLCIATGNGPGSTGAAE
jgi:hypothetical protein